MKREPVGGREIAERTPLGVALPVAREIVAALVKKAVAREIEEAGSLRRRSETVGDINIVASGRDGGSIIEAFTGLPLVKEVLAAGEAGGMVLVEGGIRVDLRVVPRESFGAALQYFTGSKGHNIRIRRLAEKRGFTLNEHGLFRRGGRPCGRKEKGLYRRLGLRWIPPELREDRGEIEAALAGRLPGLIRGAEIRGDLHLHSRWSDGISSVEALAARAKMMGYEYIAISDHSRSMIAGRGLSAERLREQVAEIRELDSRVRGITILAGTEVDILDDGGLDFPDDLLAELDIVLASIHGGFDQPKERITERVVRAMENPYVAAIGHPTGRLIGEREAYAVDTERVLAAAGRTGTALELNAYYQRLDAGDILCRRAKEEGVRVFIGSDSHSAEHMWMMELGVCTARRGWLEKGDVLNALSLPELRKFLKRKRGK